MKIIADYHTHTLFSHGTGTIEANVIQAIAKGLQTVAISDHAPGYMGYGIDKADYKKMREIVDQLNNKYFGKIEILLGIEANIMDEAGNLDIDDDMLKYNDILLAGFHFDIVYQDFLMKIRSKLHRRQRLEAALEENLCNEIKELNTQAMIDALHRYKIQIITHPGDDQPVNMSKLAEMVGKTNTALEINNAHGYLNISQIKAAMEHDNVHFVISSDAHRPRDVGNFSGALKLLRQSGLDISRVRNHASWLF